MIVEKSPALAAVGSGAISLHGVPASCGKKGGVPPRMRKKQEPGTKRVDHFENIYNPTVTGSSSGNGSPFAQACGSSMVSISLDSYPGSSLRPSGSPWTAPYHDWGLQPYFSPPPPSYTAPFEHCSTTYSSPHPLPHLPQWQMTMRHSNYILYLEIFLSVQAVGTSM